jgi:hypothetical protein
MASRPVVRKKPRPSRDTKVEVLYLSLAGQRQFAEAILNPPEPTAAFKRAAKRYWKLFGEQET